MNTTLEQIEQSIRSTIEAFTAKMGFTGVGLDESGALHLEIEDVPVSLAVVRHPNAALWIGADLGTVSGTSRNAIPWIMQQGFEAWAYGGITCGMVPDTRKVVAYLRLLEEQVNVGTLTEVVAYLVSGTAEIRDRIARSDFPALDAGNAPPDPMASRI